MSHRYQTYILWAVCCTPASAFAHSPIKDAGNFSNGLLHPVFVPAHLLVLLALGLFIGQQGAWKNRSALALLPIATVAGLTLAWFTTSGAIELLLQAGAAIIGLMIATNLAPGLFWRSLIVASTGFAVGMDSPQELISTQDKLTGLTGCSIGITLLFFLALALAAWFSDEEWERIGIRILGSWIAASSLLTLALSFSPRA